MREARNFLESGGRLSESADRCYLIVISSIHLIMLNHLSLSVSLLTHTYSLCLFFFLSLSASLSLWVSFPVYLCLSPFFLFLSLLINTSCSFMIRIETMYRSLDILHNLPGHEERKETCETLSCALLAALRPRVRRDILNLDLSPLQEYLYVYQKLGRSVIFHYGIYFYFSFFNISVPLWVNFLVEGGRS